MNKNIVDTPISNNDKFQQNSDDIPSIINNLKQKKPTQTSNSPLTRCNHPDDEKQIQYVKPGLKQNLNYAEQDQSVLKREKYSGSSCGINLPWPFNNNKSKYVTKVDLTSQKGNITHGLKRTSFDSEIPLTESLGRKSRVNSLEQMRNFLPQIANGDKPYKHLEIMKGFSNTGLGCVVAMPSPGATSSLNGSVKTDMSARMSMRKSQTTGRLLNQAQSTIENVNSGTQGGSMVKSPTRFGLYKNDKLEKGGGNQLINSQKERPTQNDLYEYDSLSAFENGIENSKTVGSADFDTKFVDNKRTKGKYYQKHMN